MDAFLPTYPQNKKFMQNVRGRKKYPASTYPKKKAYSGTYFGPTLGDLRRF